jgi:hypothetical protein
MIQPLVKNSTFCVLGFAPWWPSQESGQTEICSIRSSDLGGHMYNVSDQ